MGSKQQIVQPGARLPRMAELLEVDLLSTFAVRRDGVALNAAGWKLTHPRQLLQLLCLQPGHKIHRDLVLECLWPEGETKASSNRLYHTVHVLRHLLQSGPPDGPASLLVFQAGMLSIAPGCRVVTDLLDFRARVAQARRHPADASLWLQLEAAVARMRPAVAPAAAEPPWLAQPREEARREQIWVWEQLARWHEESQCTESLTAALCRLVELEPTNELAHRQLMGLFDAAGHPESALAQFTACQQCLQRDLATAPSPATAALLETIARHAGARPAMLPLALPARERIVRLPVPATPMLGRDAELALLGTWLEHAQHRLVTLTAVGGMGKTRLALALADTAQARYRDGVLFVPLAGLRNTAQLAAAICRAADWVPTNEKPAALLHRRLAGLHLLLVLDGFEEVIEAAPLVTDLLAAAPALQILITSQCRLNCRAERVHVLEPLTRSSPQAATALFEQNACLAGIARHLQPTRIAAICEQLEGNARAIMWVASTPGALSEPPAAPLQAHCEERASAVATAPRGGDGLSATLTRSVSLLDADLQRLLCSAAVFSGVFSLDQLRTVAASGRSQGSSCAMLQMLMERHLLCRTETAAPHAGATQFFLPALVRRHLQSGARSIPCWPAARARHAGLFAQTLYGAYTALQAEQKTGAHTDYLAAAPDIDLALVWHAERADLARSLEMTYQVAALQCSCGHLVAGIERLQKATAQPVSTRRERQQMGWCWLGLASAQAALGAVSAAVFAARQCRRFFGVNDDPFAHRAFSTLAMLRASQLQLRGTDYLLARAAHSAGAAPDGRTQALAALQVGEVRLLQGRHAEALKLAVTALSHAAKANCKPVMCAALQAMSQACVGYGNVQRAQSHLEECQLMRQHTRADVDACALLLDRFHVAFECHDAVRAQQYLDEAAAIWAAERPNDPPVTVELARAFIGLETTEGIGLDQLPVIALATLPPSPQVMVFGVKRQCYRLRLATEAGQWAMANDALEQLAVTVNRSRNMLWASWTEEALGYAWLALGQVALARAQLARARKRQAACVMVATPRQLASWQRLEGRIDRATAQDMVPQTELQASQLGSRISAVSAVLDAVAQLRLGQPGRISALRD